MLNHLFVYGTLRKAKNGMLHPYLRKDAVFIDHASVPGRLYLVGPYPGAISVPAQAEHLVYGEVYRLLNPERVLRVLDEYEECASHFPQPHEYERLPQTVNLAGEGTVEAWIYWFRHPASRLRPIKSGDYFNYLP